MGDAMAEAVLAQWAALPKTGKPQPHEHTVLAGIALEMPAAAAVATGTAVGAAAAADVPASAQAQPQLAVVALATGTKCLGGSRRLAGGAALNDCHAEALCRRALLRWLYSEMLEAAQQAGQAGEAAPDGATAVLRLVPPHASAGGADDLFGGWRFELRPGVRLHMFISQPPCGDASILHGSHSVAADAAPAAATCGSDSSFGRTGAKPLGKRPRTDGGDAQVGAAAEPALAAAALPQQHEVESYAAAQATGVARRKPGRGDATLSMSCSDKLARWALLGLQGSLLHGALAHPLRLVSLTVGLPAPPADAAGGEAAGEAGSSDGPGSAEGRAAALAAAAEVALRRALLERTAQLAEQRLGPAAERPAPALHTYTPPAAASSSRSSRMQDLGLAPSAARRVAGGASVVWMAPPSSTFKWRQGGAPTLVGGNVEAVVGSTGLKAGSAKVPPGQPVTPSARPAVCKAALFKLWQRLAASLRQLRPTQQQRSAAAAAETAAAVQQGAAPGEQPLARELEAGPEGLTYAQAKQAAGAGYRATWRALLQPPSPLEAWIPKPAELEEFVCSLVPLQR